MAQPEDGSHLHIDGPHSPLSLAKIRDNLEMRDFTVLVHTSDVAIAPDYSRVFNVTMEERVFQAKYYLSEIFPKTGKIPLYLLVYLYCLFEEGIPYATWIDHEQPLEEIKKQIPNFEEVVERYTKMVKYAEHNLAYLHAIGMIQLLVGTMSQAKKANSSIAIYVEYPETAMHPKQQSRIVGFFTFLKNKYYGDQESQSTSPQVSS